MTEPGDAECTHRAGAYHYRVDPGGVTDPDRRGRRRPGTDRRSAFVAG